MRNREIPEWLRLSGGPLTMVFVPRPFRGSFGEPLARSGARSRLDRAPHACASIELR